MSHLYWYHFKTKQNYNTFTVPCEKSKIISFVSSKLKNVVFPPWSRFTVKLIGLLLLVQHQVLVVYLNLLLSTYNNFWNRDNLVNNQFCNYLVDQLQSYKCYNMFLNYFLLVNWKSSIHRSKNYNPSLLLVKDNISCNLVDKYYFQMVKQKDYLLFENLHQQSNLSIGFAPVLLLLIDIYSSEL